MLAVNFRAPLLRGLCAVRCLSQARPPAGTTGSSARPNARPKAGARAKQKAFDEHVVRKEARTVAASSGGPGAGATLMNEMRGEAAEALSAQSNRIRTGLRRMAEQRHAVDTLRSRSDTAAGALDAAARKYNAVRRGVIEARNGIIVQREALGFRMGNMEAVMSQYKVPPALDVRGRELKAGSRVPLPPKEVAGRARGRSVIGGRAASPFERGVKDAPLTKTSMYAHTHARKVPESNDK